MEIEQLIAFLMASLVLTLMPGPDNVFVLTESITKGQKNGLAISLGLVSGVLVHTLAAATGASLIFQESMWAFQALKYAGAGYLFYLAFQAIREKTPVVAIGEQHVVSDFHFGKLFRKGFLMNVLNPKVSLFFITFLPQFVVPSGFNVSLQMVLLGIVFMLQALVVFGLVALLSGRLSGYLNNGRFWQATRIGKTVILAGLGVVLLFARR